MKRIDGNFYMELFAKYGFTDINAFIGKPIPEERLDKLFELFDEVCDAIENRDEYNERLPDEFRIILRRFNAHEPFTVCHFDDSDNRLFCLSDLYDYVLLLKKREH